MTTAALDEQERRAAARITGRNRHWLVIWGTHSRQFWAYPRFAVAPGTIIAAADATELLSLMRQAELASAPRRQ